MRKMNSFVFAVAAIFASHLSCADAHSMGLPASNASAASAADSGLVVHARMKCGFDENGDFSCKHTKRNDHKDEDGDANEGHSSDKGSSAESHNDNVTPADAPKPPTKPATGQCFTVETTKVGSIECGSEFPARSCGAVENGMITCCCAK